MLARDESPLKRTPLHALHISRGGKMVPFAGYEMPVQYASGVLREHLHTRSSAGLFDVSHMGQIALLPKSGKVQDAALAQRLHRGGSATHSSPTGMAAFSMI
jgi:aminomethyltransferase